VRRELSFVYDYGQVYLYDAAAAGSVDFLAALDDSARTGLTVGVAGALVDLLLPLQNFSAPLVLETVDGEPVLDLEEWEHVVEFPLQLPTGRLQLEGSGGRATGDRCSAGRLPGPLVGPRLPSRGRVRARGIVAGQLPPPAVGGAGGRTASRAEAVAGLRPPVGLIWASFGRVLRSAGYTAGPMDVLVLIDKLDDLVHNAKAVPLTDQVRIDREEIYDILDQMRATIPEEIKQARWIVKERQEMLAEAKREVDRLLAEAREQAVREASQTEIVKIAERQADEIVDDARRNAREMKLEMEDWADNQLASLEVNLERFLTAVRRGRDRLHERSQETVVAGLGANGDVADEERF
jgi:F0F1-type ATP synthase membrane subunit b/b'